VASPAPQVASPAPAAPSLPSAPATDAIAAPTVPAAPASPEARTTPDQRTWLWAALGAAAALLAGLGLWLRRAARPDEVADDAAKAPAAAPPPAPPAALPPMAPPAPPERALAAVAEGLDVTLEARELTGSLIYATLSYRLTVINHGPASTGPLAVAGDLVSAHAAIDSRAQLAPEAGTLAPLHEAPPLAPGESAELSGALRMPLSAILPLAGGAAFVPLARFHITAPVENGAAFAQTRIFVVGPAGDMPGDALRPFRFDRFPGVVRDLGQREIRGSP
jgi:hypothetical protein